MTPDDALVVATAGHVDHGKSTLVRALTGTDPDRLAEERRRGLTIELGFAFAALPSGRPLALVDVPGHVRFIRSMLAGVGSVDAALLVVDVGEGWMPQSEEHLRILDLLEVRAGVVALTKVGRADDRALDQRRAEVVERLRGSTLAGAPVIATDALDGTGLDELRRRLDDLPTGGRHAQDRGRPRLWVDRAFTIRGAGTVVTGTLTGGSLHVDDRLALEPGARAVRVRGLQQAGAAAEVVAPGGRTAVNLADVAVGEVHRGDALVRPGRWHPSTVVDASLRVLDALDHPVARRGAHLLHVGGAEQAVALRVLGAAAIAPGETGVVRLHLREPLPLVPGDRFVLRDAGRDETVGGGEVLEVDPLLPASRARPDRSVQRVVDERGWIAVDELERRTGEARPPDVGRWAVSAPSWRAAQASLRQRLEAAGRTGLDVASLDERERAVLDAMADATVHGTRATLGRDDPLSASEWLAALRRHLFAPPPPDGLADATEVRDLLASGLVVELAPSVHVATEAPEAAVRVLSAIAPRHPDGLTVAVVRDALRSNRRVVVPLLEHLAATGRTTRVGDRHHLRPPG